MQLDDQPPFPPPRRESPGRPSVPRVDADRLWRRHMDLARFGDSGDGGVCRLALGAADIAAHRHLAGIGEALGLSVGLDPIGNLFLRREGREPDLPPVVCGSHCDSQPTGGRFDGIYGVLAAIEAIETIAGAGIACRRAIECVVWNNEEGARFTPGCLGSAVHAGIVPLAAALELRDDAGARLGDDLAALAAALPRARALPLGRPFAAFVEAHIEQGPLLEAAGERIGVVTGIQGYRRSQIEVTGRADHSGTTPRSRRLDAFMVASDLCRHIEEELRDDEDLLRFTVSRFTIHPNSWSVVPGRATVGIDIRHPGVETLDESDLLIRQAAQARSNGCAIEVRTVSGADPVHFAPAIPDLVEAAARRHGHPARRMFSGAGHDARNLSDLCPTGMIFVPCLGGISHNPAEAARPEDLAAGAQVLLDVALDLAERD